MRNGIFTLSLISLLSSAVTAEASDGKKILADLHKGTKQKFIPLKKLPQNFGGEAQKIAADRPQDYKATALKMGLQDEMTFQEVMRDVIHPLEAMIRSGQYNLSSISAPDATYTLRELSDAKSHDGISTKSWMKGKAVNASKANEMMKNSYSTEYVKISPFSTATALSHRDPLTSLPTAFDVESRIDLRLQAKGEKVHERGTVHMVVKKDFKTGKWALHSYEVKEGETLASNKTSFEEVNSFQKDQLSNHLRKEAIRRGGYALSMGDWDDDGNVDMVVGHLGSVELFKGQNDGTFKKASNAELGIENDTLVKSAVIADFDNDSKKDLLLVRFAPSEQQGKDIVLYKNVSNKFKRVTSIKNRYPAYYAMPSAVADFDKNGMLDFYIGFPGAKDFTVLNKSNHGFEGKIEFHPQGLFYNMGQLSFSEVTKEKLPYTKKKNAYTDGYPETAAIFPHSSAGIDYDLDGNMDIVVVDDKANLSPLYKNNGSGSFDQVADKIGLTNSDFGMGFTYADLDNDGKLEFIYTNVNFLPAERLTNSLQRNFSDYSSLPGTNGVKVFKTKDNKNYSDITALTGMNSCGDGVGGVEIIDYDNNGLPDVYVANGLWSGTDPDQDLSSLFVRANSTYNYDFQEVLGSSVGIEEANTSFMKILMGFQGNVETMAHKKGQYPSMAGYQRNCLFKNNGDGTFTEVGYLEGVDSLADGYVIATADLNKDGQMDLVLRNGDPGVEKHRYPAVQVYMNKRKPEAKSVILSFTGTKSNKDAIGTIVQAKVGNKTLTRHLIANNGAAQSEGIIHFGLGSSKKISEMTIRWPSGTVQKIDEVEAGRHHFTEPDATTKTAGN